MIGNAARDAAAQADPDDSGAADLARRYGEATNIRAFDGQPKALTEMDALVAYLQALGRMTSAPYKSAAAGGDHDAKP